MTNSPCKPSRIDFDRIDVYNLQRILSTGDMSALSEAEQAYFSMMEMVRGLRTRQMLPGGKRIVTKAAVIKLLKGAPYNLSDWMARRIYTDTLNFFYTDDGVSPKAWANLYAEKAEKMADMAIALGNFKDARACLEQAARLRGCYNEQPAEIPAEVLDVSRTVIYTTDATAVGAPKTDRKRLEMFIDSMPEMAEVSRRRVKEDAGIEKKNLMTRMLEDVKEFGEESDRQP